MRKEKNCLTKSNTLIKCISLFRKKMVMTTLNTKGFFLLSVTTCVNALFAGNLYAPSDC